MARQMIGGRKPKETKRQKMHVRRGDRVRVLRGNHAGSEGTVVITGTERVRDGRVGVDLSVAVDGPGMAPELLAKATEPNVSSKSGSSGLGLATVAEVVKESQGHLAIESAPGEGCTVTIWLPASPPDEGDATSDPETSEGEPSGEELTETPAMDRSASELTHLARG